MDMGALAKYKTITLEGTIDNVENLPENSLGDRVRKLRLSTNTTIKDLSKYCNLSEETISNIEKNKRSPNISTINKLSQALNTTNKHLLSAHNWPESSPKEIIYKYRMISGLSQRQLAKKCNLHQSTIKDYEEGKLSNEDTLKNIYSNIGYKK